MRQIMSEKYYGSAILIPRTNLNSKSALRSDVSVIDKRVAAVCKPHATSAADLDDSHLAHLQRAPFFSGFQTDSYDTHDAEDTRLEPTLLLIARTLFHSFAFSKSDDQAGEISPFRFTTSLPNIWLSQLAIAHFERRSRCAAYRGRLVTSHSKPKRSGLSPC